MYSTYVRTYCSRYVVAAATVATVQLCYYLEESQLELGGAAWAAMEAHMRDLSTALGFSSHVGVTTWSQRNFGTLYMVTSPAYQALL